MKWDEDELDYGYVLDRADGVWWHLHLARSNREYQSELLGTKTDLLLCVQKFGRGGVVLSGPFILTLDGEALGEPCPGLELDFDWGLKAGPQQRREEAKRIQAEIMPTLHASERFHRAVWRIIDGHG